MPHRSETGRGSTQGAGRAWSRWFDAVNDRRVEARLAAILGEVDAAVAARGPTCWVSGKCCNFDAYGHRMYLTGLEIAWFLRRMRDGGDGEEQCTLPRPEEVDLCGPCALQQAGMCGVHRIRPLGCRVFFCQQGTQDWQQALYESALAKIRRLHETFELPYAYMEWRAGLAEGLAAMAMRDG